MADAKILTFPVRPDLARRVLRDRARRVPCPDCEADVGCPCTAGRMSPIIRLGGPHKSRIAAAERNDHA